MTELHIRHKGKCLRHGDISVRLEHHVCGGTTRQHVTSNEFSEHIETQLDVGDGLDDTHGNEPHNSNQNGNDDRPPRHSRIPVVGSYESQCKHRNEDAHEPPVRYLRILAHHLGVDVVEGVVLVAPADPDLLGMEQGSVGDHGNDTSERQTVSHGECGGEENGRVFLVLGQIQSVIGSENLAHVVRLLRIIPRPGITEWQPVGIEGTTPVHAGANDPEEKDDANDGVDNRVPGVDERRGNITGDGCPVESDRNQTHAGLRAKDFVDVDVVGRNVGHKGESAEGLEKESWDPVPAEGADEDVEEVSVSADRPAVGLFGISLAVVVQRVHKGNADQILGPNHGCGLDEPHADESGQTKTDTLTGDTKDNGITYTKVEAVELLLRSQDISEVTSTTTVRGVGHENGQSMLLEVERTRVEVELDRANFPYAVGESGGHSQTHRIRNQLRHV